MSPPTGSRAVVRVGILGSGQLARMLAEAAHRLGLTPVVLTDAVPSPATEVCPAFETGSVSDSDAVSRVAKGALAVAFENEWVNCDLLDVIERDSGTRFLPSLSTLRQLQDKTGQKAALKRLSIPTADYESFAGGDCAEWVRKQNRRFPSGFVLKWGTLGYDGKGVSVVSPGGALENAAAFAARASKAGVSLFAEARISYRRELALVATRSSNGEFRPYPLVVSEQRNGICDVVMGPATALGVSPRIEDLAVRYSRKLADEVALVGTFALEFFETDDGDLLVNEIAPRVHNSGHYTLDCGVTSQFENHWRAILGLPLGETRGAGGFAMVNLLGPPGLNGLVKFLPVPPASGHLHWYGKRESRPGRKLGHLNGWTASETEVPKLVASLKQCRLDWIRALGLEGKDL